MLKQIIFALLLVPTILIGQSKKLELGIMFGNNGQLENTLSDFYRDIYYNTKVYYDNSYTKVAGIKYIASARYFITDHISARLKFGKILRKDFQSQTVSTTYSDFNIRQSIVNINPSICYSTRINKFEIMTGIETPFIKVGVYTANNKYITTNSYSEKRITSTGGFVWGVNSFMGLKYYFTNRINVGAEINYGLMSANIGNKYIEETVNSPDPQAPYSKTYEIDKKYKKTFFSSPEISFGVFIQLGRNKGKS